MISPITLHDIDELTQLVPACEDGFVLMGIDMQGLACLGDAVAVWQGKDLVGCGGILTAWPGVGVTWMVPTPLAAQRPHFAVRAIRGFLADRVVKNGYWRLELNARLDDIRACKLAEVIGFRFEGIRRQYNPDRTDSVLYAWTEKKP